MKKNGFTLIELLAIIIVIGIVILIAVPSVTKVISESKQNALITNANMLSRVGISYFSENKILGTNFQKLFDLSNNETYKILNIKKNDIKEGTVIITDEGNVSVFVTDGKYCAIKSHNEKNAKIEESVEKCRNPYYINTIEDLVILSNEVNAGDSKENKNYFLTKDLDFNNEKSYSNSNSLELGDINKDGNVDTIMNELTKSNGFYAIGNVENTFFSGNFNGLGNKILNLYMNNELLNQALFKNIQNSTISDLTLTGRVGSGREASLLVGLAFDSQIKNVKVEGTITKGAKYIGLLASEIYNTEILNCSSSGIIENNIATHIGGLIAKTNDYSKVVNSYSTATVIGKDHVGGLIGRASEYSEIITSYAKSNITGERYVGGLIGSLRNEAFINDCYTYSNINANNNVGGLVGLQEPGSTGNSPIIMNSYSEGNLNVTHGYAGGLVGNSTGRIYNSFSNINITSNGDHGTVGGLIGRIGSSTANYTLIDIQNTYFNGNIKVNKGTEIGTLVGQNGDSTNTNITKVTTIKNSYSQIDLNGTDSIGLIGNSIMNGENLFNGGQMSGLTNVGTIFGQSPSNSIYKNVYSINQINSNINNGTIIEILNNDFFEKTLSLGEAFSYEEGYYPQLKYRNQDGTYSSKLLNSQKKIRLK